MILLKYFDSDCMKFDRIRKYRVRSRKISEGDWHGLTRKRIAELLFENCVDCEKMAAIPQGAFAAYKVRLNDERILISLRKKEKPKESAHNARPLLEEWELTPLKYNSKLMNSIWGLYNRYSVHNFKKNNDANGVADSMVQKTSRDTSSANVSTIGIAAATLAFQIMHGRNVS